jgi:hypothetical protein
MNHSRRWFVGLVSVVSAAHDLRQVTGVRYSGELGHPFHVVDDETVVLPLDHPFVREGRFACCSSVIAS